MTGNDVSNNLGRELVRAALIACVVTILLAGLLLFLVLALTNTDAPSPSLGVQNALPAAPVPTALPEPVIGGAKPAAAPEAGFDLEAAYSDALLSLIPDNVMAVVTADGGVEVPLPTDIGMPDLPDCRDLNPEDCEWRAKMRSTYEDGEETIVIEANLKKQGKTIGRGMLLRVRTAAFEQLAPLAEKGIPFAWVSHIMVDKGMRGQGIGQTVWRATDAMLKSVVGSGEGVHVFVDQAGWGSAIMERIPSADIIYAVGDTFAYIVR
ncbi:MAG: hypothetical protein JSV16_09020 [Candidatus Hydrogenedentota bacterium]|nr:MAG: hypothetical protein JSV16_09020 [Candidatus Hydrogenedentota bacterium]